VVTGFRVFRRFQEGLHEDQAVAAESAFCRPLGKLMADEPKIEQLAMREADMEALVMPQLLGSVFHVTTRKGLDGILRDGSISSNSDGAHGYVYPQSKNCIGRELDAVCLFDLRDQRQEEVEQWLLCYAIPTVPQLGNSVAFLFLSPSCYHKLILWPELDSKLKSSGNHIPEIECWYPGNLPVSEISHVVAVDVDRPRQIGPVEMLARFIAENGWAPSPPRTDDDNA